MCVGVNISMEIQLFTLVKRNFCNGPDAKFLIEHTYFFKRGAGDLIFTTCDCYSLNNVVFNFGSHS